MRSMPARAAASGTRGRSRFFCTRRLTACWRNSLADICASRPAYRRDCRNSRSCAPADSGKRNLNGTRMRASRRSRASRKRPSAISTPAARRNRRRATRMAIYAFVKELYARRRVSNATYARVHKLLGDAGIVELVGILGYYVMISMMLNVFRMPVPEGVPAPFNEPVPPGVGDLTDGFLRGFCRGRGVRRAMLMRCAAIRGSALRHRRGDQHALPEIAAHHHQRLQVRRLSPSLRPRGAAETMREIDHGLANRGVRRIGGAALHERPVDFQFRERQIAQARERRKAGAEIVDRDD